MRVLLVVFLLLLLPGSTSAQSFAPGSGAPFTINASPAFPLPYSSATLTFLSSTIDLANATIRVFADGKEIYAGSAVPVRIQLQGAGTITHISADVSVAAGTYSEDLTITPQDVVLIAEPLSYTPALYPGKSRVPLEGNVRVVAIANLRNAKGAVLPPSSLSYAWTVDDTKEINSSGIGKSVLLVAAPLEFRSREVSVTVTSPDGTLTGGASVSLLPENPVMRVYENDPLLGIRFEREIADQYAVPGEESLFAAPFSLPLLDARPVIQWFLGGDAVQTGSTITLRPTGTGQGTATLSVVGSAGSYAKATKVVPLLFGTKTGTNFFGL